LARRYENQPAAYNHYCNPATLALFPERSIEFWQNFSESYEAASLHGGYETLGRWLGGGLTHLKQGDGAYCYTSNVDGLMRRLPAFEGPSKLCEIHGCVARAKRARVLGQGAKGLTLGGVRGVFPRQSLL
jgi:hypothetical protein